MGMTHAKNMDAYEGFEQKDPKDLLPRTYLIDPQYTGDLLRTKQYVAHLQYMDCPDCTEERMCPKHKNIEALSMPEDPALAVSDI